MKETKKPNGESPDEETGSSEAPPNESPRREFLVTTGLSAAALLVGCGDDSASPTDAGAWTDGSLGADAGFPDAGVDSSLLDAAGPDAADAPSPSDAGPDVPQDAGLEDPEDTPQNDTDFAMGVSAGDATEAGAVLWTYYVGESVLSLSVWPWDGSAYGARVIEASVVVADGGFIHESVDGLTPGERYRYAFFEIDGGEEVRRSPIGAFRCAIAAGSMEVVRFGAVSCTRNDLSSFAALRQPATRSDLDAFLLLGDTTYNDGASSLAQFRSKWAENLSRVEYKDLFASVGLYATWDDHEIDNNWDAESVAPATFQAAKTALWENLPLRRLEGAEDRIWRSHRWGDTVEVFVLDCRGERRPSQDEYISPAQMAWLKTGLSESTARFKVIMNSVGVTHFPFTIASADRWQSYVTQRAEIVDHIDAGIDGVLWVAGDFHFTCLGRVGRNAEAAGWNQYEVLVGPGAQSINPGHLVCRAPQFPFAAGTRNYTELTFDPAAGEITIRWFGEGGLVFETQTIAV